jgi:hypothetical protein
MKRLNELIADALDAAEDGPLSWFPSGLVIGVLLLLVAGSAVLATSLLSSDPDRVTVTGPGSAEPSRAASPDAQPVDGVAGSKRLAVDFDLLPTGSRVDGWTLSAGARLVTAAQPTAVDRSARLDGEESATACQGLDIELAELEATFMIDSVPEGEVTLLALAFGGGTHRLTLTDGRATESATSQAVALEPGTWYRWAVVNGEEGFQLRLLAADGTPLTEPTTPRQEPNARATQFCMTAAPSTRLYLSDLTVEIR